METAQTTNRNNSASLVSLIAGIFPWILWLFWFLAWFLVGIYTLDDFTLQVILDILLIAPAILGLSAIIAGIVSLNQIKKSNEAGKAFSIAGLILGSMTLVAWIPISMVIALLFF